MDAFERANEAIRAGKLAEARDILDAASREFAQAGDRTNQARSLHTAGTLSRFTGDLEGAESRARQAAELAAPGTPPAVSAHTELGEIKLARKDGAAAAQAYTQALEQGKQAGMIPGAQASLLRRRATANAMAGRFTESAADLKEAERLLKESGQPEAALHTAVERATALEYLGESEQSDQALNSAVEEATRRGDHAALSDLWLLRANRHVRARNLQEAQAAVKQARQEALDGVAPMGYMASAMALSEIDDLLGDKFGAYEALAVGWVTLADLLGRDFAKGVFEPKLLGLRAKWGADEFAQVKASYEQKRRETLSRQ